MMAPARVPPRKPGAFTSMVRWPACAPLPSPAVTLSVNRLGKASTTAAIAQVSRTCQVRLGRNASVSTPSGTTVKVKPRQSPSSVPVLILPATARPISCDHQRGMNAARMK